MRLQVFIAIGSILLLALPVAVWAESSSSSYILWGNSFTSGGTYSTSTNFRAHSSIGDLSRDEIASSSYYMKVGFQAIYEEPKITMSVTGTSITLSPNPLTTGSVSTGSSTIVVQTNADFGYSLTATESAEFSNQYAEPLADVSDGAVTAGSEEFGIAVSGTDAAFGDDRSVSTTPRLIASRTNWIESMTTTVTYKAAIASVTDAGTYNGSIVYIATGNY